MNPSFKTVVYSAKPTGINLITLFNPELVMYSRLEALPLNTKQNYWLTFHANKKKCSED